MLTKSMYLHLILISVVMLFAATSIFADVAVLERIAKAGNDVDYVGLRLKTRSVSSGSRTMEEMVIHKSADVSYFKVVSVVGGRRSINEEPRRDNGREDRNRERDDRNRNREGDDHRRDSEADDRRRSREFRWIRQRSQFSTDEIKLIAENYDLNVLRWGEKIAGHETDLLIIKPKHEGRATKHIYFARKNGVMLRVEDLDAAGVLRDMFVYTRISFDLKVVENKWKEFEKEIKPETRPDSTSSLAKAEKVLKKKPIVPQFMPTGFKLQRVNLFKFDGYHLRLKYTDGLLDFNIFETTGEDPFRRERNRERPVIKIGDTDVRIYQRGPTHAYRWSMDGIYFFLSGEIPSPELQKVVESMILKPEK